MKELILIAIGAALVNNVVLSQFLGICAFLGVSKKMDTAAGMGGAVIFVLTISSFVTSLIYKFILAPADLDYLKTIVFILVIAALVQLVEMFLKKTIPSLYRALGVYLPLITTNCAVLGVALIKHGLPLPVYRGYEERRGQDFPRGRRSVDDFISGKILYFCIHDVERLGFGGYGSLGELPSAGQPAAV